MRYSRISRSFRYGVVSQCRSTPFGVNKLGVLSHFHLGFFFFLPVSVEVYNLVERDGREKLYAFTHKMLPK